MLYRTTPSTPGRAPLRPVRLLVEDPTLLPTDVARTTAFEITRCSGPIQGEVCPLVTSGECPLGPFDVAVCALDTAWAPSVIAAWAETATTVIDATGLSAEDPVARFRHHIGAAVQQRWPAPVVDED